MNLFANKWVLSCAVAVLSVLPSIASAAIVNGGFETAGTPNGPLVNPNFDQYTGAGGNIAGWTVTGSDVLVIDSGYTEGSLSFNPHSGSNALDITGAGNTSPANGVFQNIATVINQGYNLTFYVGRLFTNPTDSRYSTESSVGLSIDGGAVVEYTNSNTFGPVNGVNWKQFVVTFVATGTSTNIAFTNTTPPLPGGNNYAGLDDVSVEATPEPATLAIWGGISALGFAAAYRRKRALLA